MVVLNKIYTKTGDAGETALGNGARVAKHAMRVTAYGTTDELKVGHYLRHIEVLIHQFVDTQSRIRRYQALR